MRTLVRRSLDWVPAAPVHVTRTRRIEAPVDRIWEEIAAHERWPSWFGPVTSVDRIDGGAGVGSGRRVHIRFITFEEEFLAWEPGHRFAFTVLRTNVPGLRSVVEDVQLEAEGHATTVRYTQAIDVAAAAVVAPLLRRAVPRTLDQALDGLARHVTS